MKTKISIIVPVYNVENYLEKCLDSLCAQTMDEIEIILVDDGSTDKSGEICDLYAQKHCNIVVYHQQNGGVSKARNQGISLAKGQYVMFVDADDFVSSKTCEDLYAVMIDSNADLVMSNFQHVYGDEKNVEEIENQKETIIYTQKEAFYKITSIDYQAGVNCWGKLYRKELIDKCQFAIGVPLGEDIAFVFTYLELCKKVALLDYAYYYYVMREGSAMHTLFNVDKERKLQSVFDMILGLSFSKSSTEIRNRMMAFRICMCEMTIMNKMISLKEKNRKLAKELQKYIRNNLKQVLIAEFPLGKKIQICVLAVSVRVYSMIFSLIK